MPERNKPRLKNTAPALADIEDIATYTVNQWGEAQARKYLAQIDQTIHAIVERPESGRARYGVSSAIKAQGRFPCRVLPAGGRRDPLHSAHPA